MAYIAAFDPEWHDADPDKDIPFNCPKCGWAGTREDCDRLIHRDINGDTESGDARYCPNCSTLVWDDEVAA